MGPLSKCAHRLLSPYLHFASEVERKYDWLAIIEAAMAETSSLLFGPACPVRFPMHTAVVDTYADAK